MKKTSLLKKLFSRTSGQPANPENPEREYVAEALEARVLFSATPIEAEFAAEAVAEEAPAVNEAQTDGDFSPVEAADLPAGESNLNEDAVLTSFENLSGEELGQLAESNPGGAALNGDTLASVIEGEAAAGSLDDATLRALWNEGINRWTESGISAEQLAALEGANVEVHDLEGNLLGATSGTSVVIDDDGAGRGWFVDATPGQDEEFATLLESPEGIDLLSAILHEQGHVLGLDHTDDVPGSLMDDVLGEGERRSISVGQAAGAVAGSHTDPAFLAAADDPGAVGFSTVWQLGTDNGNFTSDFAHEANSDEHYYFAGTYPSRLDGNPDLSPAADEPLNTIDRVLIGADPTNFFHFNLTEDQLKHDFVFDLDSLLSGSPHDLTVIFNGVTVHVETNITTNGLIRTPVFNGASVGATTGENILEITKSGGAGNYIGLDFIRLLSKPVSDTYFANEDAPSTVTVDPVEQDFDGGGANSTFIAQQIGSAPAGVVTGGGPTGNFYRLTNNNVNGQNNAIAFDRTLEGPFTGVNAQFDFRLNGGASPADGFGFVLLSTAEFGTTGNGPGFTAEEPNLAGSLGIGFDLHPAPLNEVSLHFNNSVRQTNNIPLGDVDLDAVVFHRAIINVVPEAGGGSRVSVSIIPDVHGTAGTAIDVFSDVLVADLDPYEARVMFRGRTGGLNTDVDLDNINVVMDGLLANDTGDIIISSDSTSASGASVAVNGNGSFTYDPTGVAAIQALEEGAVLTDTFSYTIADSVTVGTGTLDWDFNNTLEGWTVLNGGVNFQGGNIEAATDTGGRAHDAGHETLLIESPTFQFNGTALTGGNALIIDFEGGQGNQGGSVAEFDNPGEVLAFNGGDAASNGLKAVALFNTDTGEYDATLYDPGNGGGVQQAVLSTGSVSTGVNYRLHFYENDEGSWGWTRLNRTQVAGGLITPGTTETATVSVQVTGVNDAPVATDNTAGVTEDTAVSDSGNVITDDDGNGIDSDVDSPTTLRVTEVDGVTVGTNTVINGTHGDLTISGDGSYTYDLNNTAAQSLGAGEEVTDSFDYTLYDGDINWNFSNDLLNGWTVLNGVENFSGNGITAGQSGGGFAHDAGHETFLVESPTFQFDGTTLSGGNALIIDFDGGQGNQGGSTGVFTHPGEVTAFNGGNSASNGLKAVALLNTTTGQYDATLFDPSNGGGGTATLSAGSVSTGVDYRLHFYENDEGSWGWTRLNQAQVAGTLANPMTDTGTLTVTVTGTNDAPDAEDNSYSVDEDDGAAAIGNVITDDTGAGADSDIDGDGLRVIDVNTTGTIGTVNVDPDGNFTYDPNGQFESLAAGETATDTFTYTIGDGTIGRFLQVIESTDDGDERFHLGELEVFGLGVTPDELGGGSFGGLTTSTNDVADGTATTFNIGADLPAIGTESSTEHGDHNAVHDNAMQSGGSVWSTSNGQPTRPQYTLDLGDSFAIDKVRAWPRADGCCSYRWDELTFNLYADDGTGNPGALVKTVVVADPGGNVPHEISFGNSPTGTVDWDFNNTLEGWNVLKGGVNFQGGNIEAAISEVDGNRAHDAGHETLLIESPIFQFDGNDLDGTNALIVDFEGGAGNQGGSVAAFTTPGDVLEFNGGNSASNGLKAVALYNTVTGEYDATLFDPGDGGTGGGTATLSAGSVSTGVNYRLHFYENDDGGWGWTRFNRAQLSGGIVSSDTATVTVTINGENDAPVASDDTGYVTDEDTVLNVPTVGTVGQPASSLTLAQDPLLYYRMDETGGTTADNLGSLGAAADGTLNGATAGSVGQVNGAFSFDGNDFISTGATASQLGIQNGSFTASAWVNPDATNGDRTIFGTNTGAGNQGLHLIIRDGNAHFGFYGNDTGGNATIPTGEWTHLTWVYDVSAQTQSLYVNGALDNSTGSHGAFTGNDVVNIGVWLNNRYFDGLIDEAAIIGGKALDVTEVAAIYNAGRNDGLLANDTDPDFNGNPVSPNDTLTVSEVNGNSANVGSTATIASGATVTVQADGSFAYDPNGAFEYLAVGETAVDTFSYTVSDGGAVIPTTPDGKIRSVGIDISGGGSDGTIDSLTEAEGIYAAAVAAGFDFAGGETGILSANGQTYNVTLTAEELDDRVDFGGSNHDFTPNENFPGNMSGDDFMIHSEWSMLLQAGTYTIYGEGDDGFSLKLDGVTFDNKFGDGAGEGAANEIRRDALTGNTNTGGTFTLGADTVVNADLTWFERGGGEFFELSIQSGASTDPAPDGGAYQPIADGVLGMQIGSDAAQFPTTTGTVSVVITGVNDPPVAVDDTAATDEDTVLTVGLGDDFNDNSIDGTKWNVVTAGIPQSPAGVTEQNQQIELQGRGHFNTVDEFVPSAANPLNISGTWEFVSGDDFIQVLTRSDGTPGGGFGETLNGIEFFASGIDEQVRISQRVAGGSTVISSTGFMPNGISGGDEFSFSINDDGENLSFTLTRISNPADSVTVTATSTQSYGTNLVSIHNRESGRRSNLDDISITQGGLLDNDTDPDLTDTHSVVRFDGTSANGAVVNVSAGGAFTYDPTGSAAIQALDAGDPLADTFTYTITDNNRDGKIRSVGIDISGGGSDADINNLTEAENIYAAAVAAGFDFANGQTGMVTVGSSTYNVTLTAEELNDRVDFGGSNHDFTPNENYPGNMSGDHFLIHSEWSMLLKAGTYTVFGEGDDGFSLKLSGVTFDNKFGGSTAGAANEIRFENPTGNSNTGGTFTLAVDTVVDAEMTWFERTGGDYFELSIRSGATTDFAPTGGYTPIADGVLGMLVASDSSQFSTATVTVNVGGLNDAPVLGTGVLNFNDVGVSQLDNDGDLISFLVNGQITDVDDSSVEGIAITGTGVTGGGGFEYSTDGGGSWTPVGTVSESSALLLTTTANDRLRFVPDGTTTTDSTLTFRAWDQTGTTAGQEGTNADVTSIGTGGTTPFSTAAETVSVSLAELIKDGNEIVYAPTDGEVNTVTVTFDAGTSELVFVDTTSNIDSGFPGGGTEEVRVLLASGDDLTIETGDENDTIILSDLGIFDGNLSVDGEAGRDQVIYQADGVTLDTGDGATFTAEEIDFVHGDLTTTDGDISLDGTGGTGTTHQGIHLLGSDLSTGSGSVTLNGSGGDTGNSNQGVLLTNGSSVSTTGGSIDIDGVGGGTGVAEKGVMIYSGSSLSAGGAGNLTIDGTAGAGSSQNEGVFFNSGTSASVVDGAMTITGTGSGSAGQGLGVSISNTTLSGTGSGSVTITGTTTATGGHNNAGVQLWSSTVDFSGGTGDVTVSGVAGTGSVNNMGLRLSGTDVTAGAGGSIDLDGQGGAGTGSGNIGLQLTSDSNLTVSGTGTIDLDGTGGGGTLNNDGVDFGTASDLNFVDGNVTIDGAGTGTGGGQGIVGTTLTLAGTGSGTVTMTGSSTASGSGNQGILLTNSSIDTSGGTGTITLTGTGSTAGVSNNDGIRLSNTDLATAAGVGIDLDGTGGGTGTGTTNSGVTLMTGSTIAAGGGGTVDIDGTGGSGTMFNRGVYLSGAGSSVTSGSGAITIDGTANGTLHHNRGIETGVGASIDTTGSISLTGTGSTSATGIFNTGIFLSSSTVGASSSDLVLLGTGGGGTSFNQGIRAISSTIGNTAGGLTLTGTGGGTSGVFNNGVYVLGGTMNGTGASITGTSGGGTILNQSVYILNVGTTTITLANISPGGGGPLATNDPFVRFI